MKWLTRLIKGWRQVRFERAVQHKLNRLTNRHNQLLADVGSLSEDLKRQRRVQQRYFKQRIDQVGDLLEELKAVRDEAEEIKTIVSDHNEEIAKKNEIIRVYEDYTFPRLNAEHDLSMEMLNKWTALAVKNQYPEGVKYE